MTREEQIAKRAEEVTSRFCYRHGYSNAKDAFIEGAKWADNNQPSPWVSVEERLPETTDEFGRSEDVLILDENEWRTVAMYCIPENKWYLSVGAIQGDCEYPFEITHWMPIPKLQEE